MFSLREGPKLEGGEGMIAQGGRGLGRTFKFVSIDCVFHMS